jgi:hypothetical protein
MAHPPIPEPKFFLQEGSENNVDNYIAKYFDNRSAAIWGEKSASYIESREAASRIAKAFPDAYIVFILRNPVYRAISNYWYTVANKLEDQPITVLVDEKAQNRPFTEVSTSPYGYLNRGNYVNFLDMYSEYFQPDQFRILIQEQFVNNRSAVQTFYKSLGIADDFVPKTLANTINDVSYSAESTPAEVLEFLNDRYIEPNRLLHERYGLETSLWQKEALAVSQPRL